MVSRQNRWLIALSDPQSDVPMPGDCVSPVLLESLIPLANYHGTTPALRRNLPRLKKLPGADVATIDALCKTLDATCLAQTARCMVLGRYGCDIETRLREANLPGVVFKGPALATAVYPTPALRTFTDIDLLAPRERVAEIRELLTGMGLTPQQDYKADLKHDLDHYGEEVFSAVAPSGMSVCIELHWNLVNSPSVQKGLSVVYDDLVSDGAVSLESQLLIATVHGATSHQFDRLKFLVDTLQVLRTGAGKFDLDALGDLITRTAAAGVVAMGCWLVDSLFGVDLGGRRIIKKHLPAPRWLDRRLLSANVLLQSAPSALAKSRKNLYRQRLKRTSKTLPSTFTERPETP